MPRGKRTTQPAPRAESYQHPESSSPMRPDVGTQAQFKKRKPPVTYRYDSSLSLRLIGTAKIPLVKRASASWPRSEN